MHLVSKYRIVTIGILIFLGTSLFYLLLLAEHLNFLFTPVTSNKPPDPLGLEQPEEINHFHAKLNQSKVTNEIIINRINDDDDSKEDGFPEVTVDIPSPKLEMEDLNAFVMNQTIKNFGHTSRIFYSINAVEGDRLTESELERKVVSLENEEFTIVMMTYKRTEMMLKLLKHLDHLPRLNQLILIWNNDYLPEPELRWPTVNYKIRLVSNNKNTLHNRYLPLSIVKTEAIFLLDDDSFVRHEKFLEAFRIWQQNRDRIVGFKGRGVIYVKNTNSSVGRWVYDASPITESISLVLTGCAFIHRNFMDLYTYEMPKEMRKIIDETMNCDDLAINFLVADRIQKSPIFVRHDAGFLCPGCEDNGLWKDSSHFKERTNCLNQFSEIFGYMPLYKQGGKSSDVTIKPEDCGHFHFQSILPRILPSLTTSNANGFQSKTALTLSLNLIVYVTVISNA